MQPWLRNSLRLPGWTRGRRRPGGPTSLLLPWGRRRAELEVIERLARFEAAYEEALRALPTCLDAWALQAYQSIPLADRATVQAACQQMAAVFEPPSSARLKFFIRRWKEGESPLAFRCWLLELAKATYPDLEGRGLDSLALERLLAIAGELVSWASSIPEEAKITSLAVAHNMQAHRALQCPAMVAACASVLLLAVPVVGVTAQGEGTITAVANFDHCGRCADARRLERRWRAGPPRPQGAGQVICFRWGQQGHFERGYNNAPGAFVQASPPATGSPMAGPRGPQASCAASIAWPLPSPHAPSGVRVHPHGLISKGSGSEAAWSCTSVEWPRRTHQ
ncbi:unnamed protein product [Lampetra fluviatilis]